MEPLNTSSLDAVDVDKSADVDYLMEQPLSAKDDKLVPGTVSIDANDVDVSRNTQGQLTTSDDNGSHNSVNRPIISAPQAQQVFYRGYENTSGEWEEYSHYINAESFEAGSTDVYNENSSLMFHSGYGYSPHIPPYEPYSPVTTPLPSASGDSQQHFSQIFPFASPYYRQPPSPSMPYLTSPTPISQPGLTIPTTPVEHQSAFVADNSNVVPLGPRPDYSLPYGSFGREFFFGNSSNPGFYDLHQGFDGFGSGGFWSDWPKSPDGIGFTTPLSSLAGSPQPTGAFGSFRHGMGPVVSGLVSQQHKSSYGSSTSSYDRGYIHGGMYHQGGNFGGSIPSIGTNGRGFIAIDKGRRRGKGRFSVCSCSGSPDFLNEQNRGPRSTKPKNISVEHKLAVDSINDNSSAVLDRESYNWLDFSTDYKDAKFFIIKSYSEDNIHKSIKYGVWASTSNGNKKLDFAYREAKGKGDSCSVFLFFSVNASAQFCGVAEMVGPVDFEKSVDYWQQDKWSGQFPVKWHIIKDVPNNLFRHIILENNDNKPVTNSRDTQEVKLEQGLEMLSTFKKHEADMSILDDFAFYEERQKAMQEKKAARQQLQQSSSCTGTVLPAAVEEVQNIPRPNKGGGGGEGVIVNHITKTFAQVVRLDETSKPADLLVDKRSSTSGDVDANANVNANTNANTDVHPAVSALNVLFTSLNSPSQLMGWSSSGGDPCGGFWKGIKCSSSSVTEIKMSGLGLSGSLGYQLSSLTSVTHFDLSKNNLQGDIPYQLPPNAVHINLAGNALNGGIPYSVSQMTDIEYLNLASNQLNGQLTDIFGKLPKLSQLDLSFNQFSGNLPQSIGSLKSLKTLYLQNNQFTGSINVLANLPLDDLNVQNNQFTGSVPDRLKKIDNLQIDGNSLSGASSRTGGKKRMSGVVIVLIVIAALLVLVLLLAFIKRRKSSFQSPYIYEQSVKTRSFTPLVDNDLKDKSISASSSIDLKGLHTDPSLDLKPLSPLPSSRQGTLKGNEFSSRQGSLRENEFSSGQESLKENKFAVRSNSKHRTNTAHARAYSLRDLQAATGSFSSSRLVGNGSIGCVYKAKYADGKVLAVKKVDSDLDGDFMDVISSISRLHHPNISELIGFCSESGLQLLVYGYERNGSLHDFLHLSDEYSNPLTWDTRVRIALGTARAIEYLHEVSVPSSVHKNIKSANILLDAELNPHLSDCGLTAYYKDTHNNNLGPGCNAPECTKPSAYTLKSDVYSFGVVMLELLTGRKPYDSSKPRAEQLLACWAASQLHDREALANIADPALRGLYPPKSLSRFADIIALCIQANPEMRPAMSEIVQTLGKCVQRTSINKRVGLGLSGEMSASQRSDDSNYGYY